jgi:AraC-like DNA-binding protein
MPDIAASDSFARLLRARRLIDERFNQPLTLETLASEACFSRYHFLRQFQREFRQTPHEYLQARRIERARQLLASGHHSVTEVCLEVGFESVASFSTLFRKTVGQPPSTYRARSLMVVPGFGQVGPLVLVPGCFVHMFGLDRRPRRLSRQLGGTAATGR